MPRFLLLFLALIALFNLSRVLREPRPDADRPMDFRTCYVGQEVLRRGENPYDDATLKSGWQRITAREHLATRTQPGLPNLPFLYPPWAAALFGSTIGQLPYAVAWPVWYALAVLSLGLLAWLWPKVLRAENVLVVPWWQFLLAALALKGTVPALLTGQPTFAALALGVGALVVAGGRTSPPARIYLMRRVPWRGEPNDGLPRLPGQSTLFKGIKNEELKIKNKTARFLIFNSSFLIPFSKAKAPGRVVLAGLLLGLAAFKVTLLLPFAAWFLWRRQWRALAVAAVVVAALSALAWHWAAFPADLLPTYQHLLAQVRAQSFDPTDPDYPLTQGMTLRLELGNVLEWLRPGSSPWHLLLHGVLWLAALLRLAWLRRQGTVLADWHVFLVVSTLTLLTTYHLYYDAVLLLPLLVFGRQLARPRQWLLLGLLLPLLLPLNGLALALGNPVGLHWLYFLMPLSLLGVLAVLLAWPMGDSLQRNRPSC